MTAAIAMARRLQQTYQQNGAMNMSTTKEWGVKQAAERLAKALVALNIPATVVETGVADWPVAIDVLGTKLPMQKSKEQFRRDDPNEFVMQHNKYGHRLRVTRTGQIDTDDLVQRLESRRADDKAVAEYNVAKEQYAAMLERYADNVGTGDSPSKVNVSKPSGPCTDHWNGRVHVSMNMEMSVAEAEQVVACVATIRKNRAPKGTTS